MRITSIAGVLAVIIPVLVSGCRKDAGASPEAPAQGQVPPGAADANPRAGSAVTLRIRKLGGADRKQIVNQMLVTTPVGDEFTITEQVGTTQLEFRGKVLDLTDGRYRVSYEYAETSAAGRRNLKSTVEMTPNTEKELGGLMGAEAMETIVLALSRP